MATSGPYSRKWGHFKPLFETRSTSKPYLKKWRHFRFLFEIFPNFLIFRTLTGMWSVNLLSCKKQTLLSKSYISKILLAGWLDSANGLCWIEKCSHKCTEFPWRIQCHISAQVLTNPTVTYPMTVNSGKSFRQKKKWSNGEVLQTLSFTVIFLWSTSIKLTKQICWKRSTSPISKLYFIDGILVDGTN